LRQVTTFSFGVSMVNYSISLLIWRSEIMISCLFYDKISFYLVADAAPKVVLAGQPLNVLHADGLFVHLTVSHPLEAVEDHTSIESLGTIWLN
jgi:hypothetical protein